MFLFLKTAAAALLHFILCALASLEEEKQNCTVRVLEKSLEAILAIEMISRQGIAHNDRTLKKRKTDQITFE